MSDPIEWLSRGGEALLGELKKNDREQVAGDAERLIYDLVIVGSGYGGAVAAARLGGWQEGGRKLRVAVIERGREYLPGDFPASLAMAPKHVRVSMPTGGARGERLGLFDLRLGTDINVLLGNGLGGGSLINAGVMVEPLPEVFTSGGWPAAINRPALDAGYASALAMIGATKVPANEYTSKLEALAELAKLKAKKLTRPIAVNYDKGLTRLRKCENCGDCVSGCNIGAKRTLDTNYLATAREAGVEFHTGLTVLALSRIEDHWQLEITPTDTRLAARSAGPAKLAARHVVLAAGSLGSTEILLRSQQGGLALSNQLGTHFSGNGDAIAAIYDIGRKVNVAADERDPIMGREVGPTITGLIDLRAGQPANRQLVVEELGVPGLLRRLFDETLTTGAWLQALERKDSSRHRGFDDDHPDPARIDRKRLDQSLLVAMLGRDDAGGRIRLATQRYAPALPGDGEVQIDWPLTPARREFHDHQIEGLRELHAASGLPGTVLPDPIWHGLPGTVETALDAGKGVRGPRLTVHPLGGCPMGDDVHHGVVDDCGRVFNPAGGVHPGLAVLDGSIVPTALGINPALSIAALAERAVLELRAQWWPEAIACGSQVKLSQRPFKDPPPPTRGGTGIEIKERLWGKLALPGKGGEWATIELCFKPVNDLRAWLEVDPVRGSTGAPPKLELAHGELRRFASREKCLAYLRTGKPAGEPIAIPTGQMHLLDRKETTPCQRRRRWLLAVLVNRLRDFVRGLGHLLPGGGGGMCKRVRSLLHLAPHLGEERRLDYELKLEATPDWPQGATLRLTKRIEYRVHTNPWRQWVEAQASLERDGQIFALTEPRKPIKVDLRYFVRGQHPLLKLTRQADMPTAWADLAAFGLWILRVVARNHIAAFRTPDAPRPRAADVAERLPGPMPGLPGPEVFWGDAPAGRGRWRLTRYHDAEDPVPRVPVLLIPGFGASGSSFTSDAQQTPLVRHLFEVGRRDVWVLDTRTSIGLPDSLQAWNFRDVAREDVVEAVDTIRGRVDGAPAIDVIAHCNGTSLLSMAAQSGRLRGKIRRAVMSQSGPVVIYHPGNEMRGYVAQFFARYLGSPVLETRPSRPPGAPEALLDALLSSYPYAPRENPEVFPWWRARPYEGARRRADGIFGQLFETAHVSRRQLLRFDEWLGQVNLASLAQYINWSRDRRLSDADGANRARSPVDGFDFPVRFVFGERNYIYDRQGVEESCRLLRAKGVASDVVLIPGYSHLDCIVGEHAARDVFPHMSDFLAGDELTPPRPNAQFAAAAAPATCAMVAGHYRIDPSTALFKLTWLRRRPMGALSGRNVRRALGGLKVECGGLVEWHASGIRALANSAAAGADRGSPSQVAGELRLALGSCSYPAGLFDAEPADAVWHRLAATIDQPKSPQLLLLVGDQVYLDDTGGVLREGAPLERTIQPYERWLARRAVRDVLTRLPTYFMLDDHEVRDAWEPSVAQQPSERIADQDDAAITAFERYQRGVGPARIKGRYDYTFAPGGHGLYMLDTRSQRLRRDVDGALVDGLLGKAQMQDFLKWLREQQSQFGARPKLVASPVVVFPWSREVETDLRYSIRCDGWDAYPASLARLLQVIATEHIENVVFLSGDHHLSSFSRLTVQASGHAPVRAWSLVSSGIYAPLPFANTQPGALALPSTNPPGLMGLAGLMSCEVAPVPLTNAPQGWVQESAAATLALVPDGAGWKIEVRLLGASGMDYVAGFTV